MYVLRCAGRRLEAASRAKDAVAVAGRNDSDHREGCSNSDSRDPKAASRELGAAKTAVVKMRRRLEKADAVVLRKDVQGARAALRILEAN